MLHDATASGRLHDALEATRDMLQARLRPPREIPPMPPMDADARLRDSVTGAYRNAGVEATAEQVAVAATAVRATWDANGLAPATTALQVKPQADGRYGPDSPTTSLRLDADGKTYVIAAETTPADIERARTSMESTHMRSSAHRARASTARGERRVCRWTRVPSRWRRLCEWQQQAGVKMDRMTRRVARRSATRAQGQRSR